MARKHTYDVVVIGAGPAGENAAEYAVLNGLSAAIIEDELIGRSNGFTVLSPIQCTEHRVNPIIRGN